MCLYVPSARQKEVDIFAYLRFMNENLAGNFGGILVMTLEERLQAMSGVFLIR